MTSRSRFFYRLHQRLETNGNFYKSRKPIHVPQRNQEAIDAIQQALEANPHTSTRAIATDLNMHHVTVHKIIKHSLGWHPFKRHTTHKLIPGDMPRRLNFYEWVIDHVSLFKFSIFLFYNIYQTHFINLHRQYYTKLFTFSRWISMMSEMIYF